MEVFMKYLEELLFTLVIIVALVGVSYTFLQEGKKNCVQQLTRSNQYSAKEIKLLCD